MRISHSRGRGKLRHNNREIVSKNVDKDRINDNIIIKQQPLDEAYNEVFGKAQAEYNAKQKRADRKIENYFKKLFDCENYDTIVKNNNKQYSFYEWVVGLGDKDTAGYKTHPEIAKKIDECLQIYMNGSEELSIPPFQVRNPNFYVFNAVLHRDENTPHLHVDVVPFADGYKTGMTRQQGIAKALEQMGYGKGDKAINNFRQAERAVFRQICEAYGLEVDEEQKGRGHTFTPQEYGEIKDEVKKEIRAEQEDEIRAEIEAEIEAEYSENNKIIAQQKQEIRELNAERERTIVNAVQIPPRPVELQMLPKPEEPENPRCKMGWTDEDLKEYNKAIPKWKKECKRIDKENANRANKNISIREQQEEWDRIYEPLLMAQKVQKEYEQQKRSAELQEEKAINLQKELQEEKDNIPKTVEKQVNEKLENSREYAEFQRVSEAYKRRYEQLYSMPFDSNTGNDEREVKNADKAIEEHRNNGTRSSKGQKDERE